jgi:hypothetical protein
MADPSDFLPSQASQSSSSIQQSKIYVDEHGAPLRFFVASLGIPSRPKLVKNLLVRLFPSSKTSRACSLFRYSFTYFQHNSEEAA